MTRFTSIYRIRTLVTAARWRAERVAAIASALIRRPVLRKVTLVAITGSAGKTSTKDLCAGLLSHTGSVTKTQQSSNDPSMLARTISAIRSSDRFGVLEIHGGEARAMDWPLRMLKPDIAVVTLIQREHARPDFGLNEIANEKFRLISALPKGGTAILNIDDPLLRERGLQWAGNIIWVGRDEGATLRLMECRSVWPQPLTLNVAYSGERYTVVTRLHGEHLALSVLCALAVALAAGMKLREAIDSLQGLEASEGRMQAVSGAGGITFIRDDWKAPVWSLDAPMSFMRDAIAPRKLMVIGTLSDYSLSASKLYPRVAQKALAIADYVVFIGAHAHRATKKARDEDRDRLRGFTELRQAALYLNAILRPGDLVLLKGSSRTDHLVRIVSNWEAPIACWEVRCGKAQFCTSCARLYDFTRAGIDSSSRPDEVPDESQPIISVGSEYCILVGLGNTGEKFRLTRHNAGHLVLDALAREQDMTWRQTPAGQVAEGIVRDRPILLVKPDTAINHSGDAIRRMLGADELVRAIVVHDDMDIDLGAVNVRRGGGDGGHLGVRSIITVSQTQDFQRIRLGVRPPGDDRKTLRLVHDNFSGQELQLLSAAFALGLRKLLS